MEKRIDIHVHFRDEEEKDKETIRGGSERAAEQGIIAVCDMPNTKPPTLRRNDVLKRLKLAEQEEPLVRYFLYIGIIPKISQIEEAVQVVREIPQVVGIKLYAGESVGNLGVTDEREQEKIYRILSELDYQEVLAVHCEKKSKCKSELWSPEEPRTHGLARPPEAEIGAVKDQIRFVEETGFTGHLHICHISCAETLLIVQRAKENGLNISGEITPHHILLDERKMREKDGLLFKVNPPLRPAIEVEELRDIVRHLIQEKADWLVIATDYAPHTRKEKLKPPYPSGIADYSLYGKLLTWLGEQGLFRQKIERLTYWNILKIFGEKLKGL